MLYYIKKSCTNNLTQRENKYATGEDNGIYFLESIIFKKWGGKKKNKTKIKKEKKFITLNKHEFYDETWCKCTANKY